MIYIFLTIFFILFFTYITGVSLFIFRYFHDKNKVYEKESLFKRFAEIISILETSKITAFEYVLQQDIYAYHTSGYKISKDVMPQLQKKYIKMTFELCGPAVTKDLETMKGDLKSVGLELSTYFITRINKEESSLFKDEDDDAPLNKQIESKLTSMRYDKESMNVIGK